MRILRSFAIIINYKTFTVAILAVISTWVCKQYGITADFPLTLIGIAIVFPIVFSIDSAYKRRENALKHYADLKAHGLSLYYGARDWVENENQDFPLRIKKTIESIMISIQNLLSLKDVDFEKEILVYNNFSKLSEVSKEFRSRGLGAGELSRANQYISKMIIAFDNMKIIYQYRTPVTLRAYSRVFIYSFPIIYGPYFAFTFQSYSPGLGYLMPILYSFILISLDNIQDHLENPYDDIGEDDIRLDVKEFMRLM